MVSSFAVIGGDKRQLAVAEGLNKDGYTVYTSALENTVLSNAVEQTSIEKAIKNSDCIILPLPFTVDYKTLNTPLSDRSILLNDKFAELLEDKKIFCGLKSRFLQMDKIWSKLDIHDYADREDFALKNAVPTSEGAIAIAIKEYERTLFGAKCLVAGFGKIGKILAKMLTNLGAQVYVSARKKSDIEWIKILGYRAINTNNLQAACQFDVIFNTIPFLIFNAQTLAKIAQNSLLIDLASKPGGVDFEAAKRMNIKTIHALALPGKFAPYSAGEIIKTTIYNMLEEGA